MSQRFTIELSAEQVQKMRELARLANEPIETVITERFQIQMASSETIDSQIDRVNSYSSIHLWSIVQDGLDFPQVLDKRMLELIQKSKDGIISDTEQQKLNHLNDLYNKYVLLRAKALAELKNRGEDVSSFFEVSEC